MKKQILFIAFSALSTIGLAQLQAPKLISPEDTAKKVNTTTDFDWFPSIGGTVMGYELQIATDTAFTSPWTSSVSGSSGSGIKMLFDTKYYWRVRAIGVSSNSPWSDRFSFTTHLNKFNLVTPTNGDDIGVVRTTLVWTNLKDLNYHVQFDTSASFSSSEARTLTLINPDIKGSNRINQIIEDLYYGKTYHWRIRGFHSNDTSGWSGPFTFTTGNTIGQLTIGDGSAGIFIDTSLSTRSMAGTDNYELRMDTSAVINAASKEYIHLINSKPVFDINQLLFGTTYYWEVRGINASNNSPWSGLFSFTTTDEVNTSFPEANDIVTQLPLFKWEGMPGIETFQVEVADNMSFTGARHANVTGDLNEFSFTNELGFGTFFWRVRAISTRDTSNWSSPVSFKTTPVGIDENNQNAIFTAYPNPASNQLTFSVNNFNGDKLDISLLDLSGKVVYADAINVQSATSVKTITLPELSDGVYMLKATAADFIHTQKIFIKK